MCDLFFHYCFSCGCRKDTELLCIIFVERIIAAKVIDRVMKKIDDLSHFNVSYLTGSSSGVGGLSSKAQLDILESFRDGRVSACMVLDVIYGKTAFLNYKLLSYFAISTRFLEVGN